MPETPKLKDSGHLKKSGKRPAETLHGNSSQDSVEERHEKSSNQKWKKPQEKAVVKLISYLKDLR